MMWLLIVIAGLLALVALLQMRNRAQAAKHYAAMQKMIAEAAELERQKRAQLDQDLTELWKRHRHEIQIETARLAERRDFDNDWGGLRDVRNAHAGRDGATDADAPGAAGD